MKEYVCGFMFDRDGQVALMKKQRPGWQMGRLNGIGGEIEKEDGGPHQAMVREYAEETETATALDDWTLALVLDALNPDREECRVYFFRGEQSESLEDIHGHMHEGETVIVCDPDALPEIVLPNVRWLVPLIKDAHAYALPIFFKEKGRA